MKKIIKIISVFLVFSILSPLCAYASKVVAFEEALEFLIERGIERYNEDGTYEQDRKITRAEFAVRVVRMLNEDAHLQENVQSPFWDVPADYYALSSIRILYDSDVIIGYEDGSFHPEEYISNYEALAVLLKVLGYEGYANLRGGYPNGYFNSASEIGLLKGVDFDRAESLTQKNLSIMIYNALFTDIYQVDYFTESGAVELKKDGTLLNHVYRIYEEEGIVNATFLTGMNGYEKTEKNEVRINDVLYICPDFDVTELLGCNVELLYRYDEKKKEKTIVDIKPSERKNVIKMILADDIVSYDGEVLRYLDKDREKSLRINKGANIIYNGVAITENEQDILSITDGGLTFISTDSGSSYSVIKIAEYENITVHAINQENKLVYGKYANQKLSLDDYPIYKITDTDGKKVDFSQLSEWDVLSVMKSKDESYIEIKVSRKTVTGTITGITNKDGKTYLFFNGEEYRVSRAYESLVTQYLFVGKSGNFYLDFCGKIAAVKLDSGNLNVGYLISISDVDVEGEYDYFVLKLLDSSGRIQRFRTAKKLKINREKNYNATTAHQELTDIRATEGLIRYKLDEFNCIKEIVTPGSGMGCGLYKRKEGPFVYKAIQKTFDGQINIDSNTIVFQVPKVAPGTDLDYSVNTVQFWNDTTYDVISYGFEENSAFADALVVNNTYGVINNGSIATIVDKVTEVLDEDELVYPKLFGYNTRGRVELLSNIPLPELERGDIIVYSTNAQGKIIDFKKVFDSETERFVTNLSSGAFIGHGYMQYGSVFYRENDLVQVTSQEIQPEDTAQTLNLTNFLLTGTPLYKVDRQKRTITIADPNEALDYFHVGNQCTKIFAQLVWGNPSLYVLYES